MRTFRLSDLSAEQQDALCTRPAAMNLAYRTAAASVCKAVQSEGDAAVRRFTKEFDATETGDFRVPESEITAAHAGLSADLRDAIRTAIANVTTFHAAQPMAEDRVETMPGVLCWRERRAIRRVGLYVPAGSAPLPSTMIMLGVPARIAGCEQIAVCSPPDRSGGVHPLILATAAEMGINELYRIGGAQAIAAMAFGTASVPKVDKVFGPGNAYVAAAKEYVSTDPLGAAIDLLAGPSELLTIADGAADPAFVAADLLSQAEHDPASQVVLVTTDETLVSDVLRLIEQRLPSAPRQAIIASALRNSFVVIARDLSEAVAFSDQYAPEHLSIQTAAPEKLARTVRTAGSVFIGPWSPVTAGDYASGTNHTLPTSGRAASMSGISVDSFRTIVTFQSLTRKGLQTLAPALRALSSAEQLAEHTRAVEVRT